MPPLQVQYTQRIMMNIYQGSVTGDNREKNFHYHHGQAVFLPGHLVSNIYNQI